MLVITVTGIVKETAKTVWIKSKCPKANYGRTKRFLKTLLIGCEKA